MASIMPDHLVFHAASTAEIHQCAYALLKYLNIYNLKPPAGQAVVIYTTAPARLDMYGTFFPQFDLRETSADKSSLDCLRDFCGLHQGPVLFLGEQTYPIAELDTLFAAIGDGQVYARHQPGAGVSALGFRSESPASPTDAMSAPFHPLDDYMAHYPNLKEFDELLADFFTRYQEESVPNQVKLMHPINAADIEAEKTRFLQLPLTTRLLKKLTGRGWRIGNYRRRI